MGMNYSISSGNAEIIIKPLQQKNNRTTILTNCSFTIDYNIIEKVAGQHFASHAEFYPATLRIRTGSLNSAMTNLLFSKKRRGETTFVLEAESDFSGREGEIMLKHIPAEEKLDEVYAQLHDSEETVACRVTPEGVVKNLEPMQHYTIMYYRKINTRETITMGSVAPGYFTIEIKASINKGGKGGYLFIEVPKANLFLENGLNFSPSNLAATDLVFNIVDKNIKLHFY